MHRKKILGVDLHGTLLDKNWKIDSRISQKISQALLNLKKKDFAVYICSGNDLEFAKKYIPFEIFENIDGLILETGCVYSDKKVEKILVDERLVKASKELESKLKKFGLKDVKYFARRLCTVSLFTTDGFSGTGPEHLFDEICKLLDKYDQRLFYATHSDVAVDIIPVGYDKFTGLERVANGGEIFAIADSYNDISLLEKSEFSFAPKNLSPKVIEILGEKKNISILGKTIKRGFLYKSLKPYGEGVSEILESLLVSSTSS